MAKNNAINSPVLGGISSLQSKGVLLGNGSNTIAVTASLAGDKAILIGDGSDPVVKTLTAGTNITFDSTSSSITINSNPGGGGSSFTWIPVSNTTQDMNVNKGYISNNTAELVYRLPSSATIGDVCKIVNASGNSVVIKPYSYADQTIRFGSSITANSTAAAITSNVAGDSLEIVCIANNKFMVVNSIGTFEIV